jgi:predicted hydrocarbon binding protein
MSEEIEVYKNNIQTFMRIVASLSLASDTLIGPAAKALMYQSGKEMGKAEGKKLDRTDDLLKALAMLDDAEQGVWQIEPWADDGATSYIAEQDGSKVAHLIFRECPIRQVCLTHGIPQDGALCRITHGLFAGMMGEIMGRKVEVKVEHAGPNACKKIVEIKNGNNHA